MNELKRKSFYHIQISKFAQNGIFIFLFAAAFGGVGFAFMYKLTKLHFLLFAGAVKDLCLFVLVGIYCLCLLLLLSKNHMSFRKCMFDLLLPLIFFTFFFILACVKGHSSIGTIATIFRRYYLPLFVIIFFVSVDVNEKQITSFVYVFIVFIILFGFLEYFLPVHFWDSVIELPTYWSDSGDRWAEASIQNSGRFVSFDLFFILGRTVRRMCSSFAEPTNFSSFCISCFLIFHKHRVLRLLCFVCCCLAVSKAALMVFFGLLPVLYVHKKLFLKKIAFEKVFIVMFFFFFALSAVMYGARLTIGPFSHIAGFYTGFLNVLRGNIFGYGIGTLGNYADSSISRIKGLGGESGIGGMLGQCGIGALFYLAFFVKLIKNLQKNLTAENYRAIVMIFAWIVICIFSESAFGASGNILFFIYPAMAVRKTMQQKSLIKEQLL